MDKFEYFSGIPEVGIVPRAPHAGPLLQHVYEQEHGRGGFAGKVSHTYHLYPPNNWLPGETRVLEDWAPLWESPLRPLGGTHHALGVARPPEAHDVYRGMARLVANATVTMSVTAPAAPMDYFFEHHSATLVFFVHQGGGALETLFGPIAYGRGDFLVVPKGIPHRFECRAGAAVLLGLRELRGRSREVGGGHHRAVHHPQPERLPLPAHARHAQRGGALRDRLQGGLGLHAAGAPDASLRRGGLARRLPPVPLRGRGRAAAHRGPLARAALGPHRLQAARLLPLRVHGARRSRRKACGCPSSTGTSTTARPSATTGATSSAAAA